MSITELKAFDLSDTDELMVRGFYPGVWGDGKLPYDVYSNYYATYIERDLRQRINVRNLSAKAKEKGEDAKTQTCKTHLY